jgi:hypothetical protein
MTYRMLQHARIGLGLVFATACSTDCTLIGCDSGLVLRFATPLAGSFHVEATSPDAGSRSYDCATSPGCLDGAFIVGYFPKTVTLTVTYQGRTATTTVSPTYQESRPNGSGCDPLCRQGIVTLPLP